MQKKFNMREERHKLGWTQEKLAAFLDITPEYLSMMENDRKPVSAKVLKKFNSLPVEVQPTAPPSGSRKPIGTAVGEYTEAHGFRQEIDDIRERLSTIERLLVKLTSQR